MGTGVSSAVILSAAEIAPSMARYIKETDFVVACDAGYKNAETLGVRPNLILGDFDSAPQPKAEGDKIVLPHVKDDTDTHYAARWLLAQGCKKITLLGVLGGARLEHTLANIATGLFLAQNGVEVLLADARSELRYLLPGHPLRLQSRDAEGAWKYLSVFPLAGAMTGVGIAGVFYPLDNATLTPAYPLGVSNEFVEPTARLCCAGGSGLVVLTRADG